jgi:DMSO/TMAO reductase YedYZ molybdopterin-dependent catalytic subunit
MSTKLGYKNAKWIKAIEVSNEFRESYWSERGLSIKMRMVMSGRLY